ncbi:hypothetical protein IFO70_10395 [Phormidium tenue FACHB-886]|nr:hypothetical protein [Phormidium tenue FACHB-886]
MKFKFHRLYNEVTGDGAPESGGTGTTTPPAEGNIDGLKSALQKERERASTFEKQSKDFDRQLRQLQESVKGIDPEKYKQFEALQAEAEKWNQKEAELKQNLETNYQQQIGAEQQKAQEWQGKYTNLLTRTQAEKAYQAAGGRAGAGEDGISFFDVLFNNTGKALKLNDAGQLEVVDANGARLYSKKDASKPMTPAEYFAALVAHPVLGHCFDRQQPGRGSGMNPTQTALPSGQDLSNLPRADRLTALRQQQVRR